MQAQVRRGVVPAFLLAAISAVPGHWAIAEMPRRTGLRCEICARALPALPAAQRPGERGASPCEDDGTRIDVLFVYTAAARIQAGSVAAITNVANDAIAEMNEALADSDVPNLSFAMTTIREIAYDEFAGNPDGVTHLVRLTEMSDGVMDAVHAWRDEDRADLASLIVASGGNFAGGVGWANVHDPGSGFTVCERLAAMDGTFTHEWGHNLGLFHQCTDFPGDYLRYARGYLWNHSQTGEPWATAMVGFSTVCPRPGNVVYIPRFSNPDLFYLGERTGIPLNQPGATHEALAIRETHFAVANFRRSLAAPDCNGNGTADATDIATGVSLDENINGRPDECEIRLYVNASSSTTGDGSSWTTARRDLAEAMRVAALPCSNVREIWVAAGTYRPDAGTGNRDLAFELGRSARIFGGFVGNETSLAQRDFALNVTTLSGDIGVGADDADNTRGVVVGYDVGAGALLDGFTISDGYDDFDGGGLYLENSSPIIRNCIFANNRARFGGGAQCANGGAPRFEDCTFTSNTAAQRGGGAALYLTSGASFVRCTFSQNAATWAGAVEQRGDVASYVDCRFDMNTATVYGGGVVVFDDGVAELTRCDFFDNDAGAWGGGLVAFDPSSIDAVDCTFDLNSAAGLGGGAIVSGPNVTAAFRGCAFSRNVGADGGGLAVYDRAAATLDSCLLIDNHALSNGGGIYSAFEPSLYLSRCRFIGNRADVDGGAVISAEAAHFSAVNCEFSGNRAPGGGGGALALVRAAAQTISDSTFASNASASNGGAVYVWDASLALKNSIAWADAPTEIGLFAGATAAVQYSDVQGGFAGAGNRNLDPLYANRLGADGVAGTLDDDLRIAATSPCIDAGNTLFVPPDALDIDGDGNIVEPTPFDLAGAARLFDQPSRPNTGVGSPPVDIGAYESQPPPCPGDLDGDGNVGLADLAALLAHFGTESGATPADGDSDDDQDVDLADLSFLLSRFGTVCT